MKSCLECFNLRCRIPLIPNGHDFLKSRIAYDQATASCSQGILQVGDGKRSKVYKGLFKLHGKKDRKAFERAQTCGYYEGEYLEDDQDEPDMGSIAECG